MPATVDDLRCYWRDCPSTGPYTDSKALYDHLIEKHCGDPVGHVPFICLWEGCATSVSTPGDANRGRHLLTHTTYRPYVCKEAGCTGRSYTRKADLMHHHLITHHELGTDGSGDDSSSSDSSEDSDDSDEESDSGSGDGADDDGESQVSEDEDTARVECLWSDCDAASFSPDYAGAAALWEHLSSSHFTAKKCMWGSCRQSLLRGAHKSHLLTHLPEWYKPFVCDMCERSFARSSALKHHQRLTHPPSSLGKRSHSESPEAQDGGPRKKRKSSRGTRIDSSSARGSTIAVDELPTNVEGTAIGKLGSGTRLQERLLSAETKIQQLEVQIRELLRGKAAAPAESSANDQLLDPTLFAYED